MRTTRSISITLVVVAAAMVGCSDDEPASAPPVVETATNAATVDMTEYGFSVEGSVLAGDTTIEVRNSGQEVHMAKFARLRPGKTIDDARSAFTSNDDAVLKEVFSQQLGAPGGIVSPGTRYRVTTSVFDEADFALVCLMSGVGDGAPHFTKGMLTLMKVGRGNVTLQTEPDATYSLSEGKIDGPPTLRAGEVTLRARATRTGPHEFIVARKETPETTFEQADAELAKLVEIGKPPPSGYVDALPVSEVRNLFDVDAGTSISVTMTLTPGTYFIGCARKPKADDRTPTPGGAHRELVEVNVT